jgi:hypothetical protein
MQFAVNEQGRRLVSRTADRTRRWPMIVRHLRCVLLLQVLACSDQSWNASVVRAGRLEQGDDVVRYRLLLRGNPVDPGEAFRCYGRCQAERTPTGYLACLGECPGFDVTPGAYCAKNEVPPVAACLVVRKVRNPSDELPTGLVVLGVVGTIALVVSVDTLCSSSPSMCGYYSYPPP